MGAGVVIVGAGLAGQRCWRGAARARVTCSAHGDCAAVAPAIFRVDDTAIVTGEATGEQVYP
jgi:hypothetical protein